MPDLMAMFKEIESCTFFSSDRVSALSKKFASNPNDAKDCEYCMSLFFSLMSTDRVADWLARGAENEDAKWLARVEFLLSFDGIRIDSDYLSQWILIIQDCRKSINRITLYYAALIS